MSFNQLEKELSQFDAPEKKEKKHSILTGVLVFFITCFLLVISVGSFLIWTMLFKESSVVSTSVEVEKTIARGVPFEAIAIITNEQDIAISEAKLVLNLPDGVFEANAGGTRIEEPIGIIQGGSSVKRTFSLIAANEKGVKKEVESRVSYVGANNNRFESTPTKKEIEVTIEPLSVAVALPDSIMQGAVFDFEIQYKNDSNKDLKNIYLFADYPAGFHFDRASIDPDSLNNRWRISSLKKGEIESIEVTGTYDGDESTPLSIPASLVIPLGERDLVVASNKSTKETQPSPVLISVVVNGSNQYVANAGDALQYTIYYENRTGIALKNAVITLTLSGDMVDTSTLEGGVINKKERSIEWNKANTPTFSLMSAGEKGELIGRVKLKDVYPIKKASDKNFSVIARVKLESPSVPPYLNTLKTSASTNIETKIGGSLGIASELRYRDPDSGIANAGLFPPKVGQGTEYTIHWVLETGATDIKNTEVSAQLENGVVFTGVSKSNIETKPEYDSMTNSVRWKIPRLPAGRGVISNLIEATFQVRATPTATNINQFMPITKETIARGVDEFTDLELSARDVALSTALQDDKTVGAEGGRVMQ